MTREKIWRALVDCFRKIQEVSNRPVSEITDETKPIGDLEGFDSLNGVELAHMVSEHLPIGRIRNLCASEDGKRALTVREIIDSIIKTITSQEGNSNG